MAPQEAPGPRAPSAISTLRLSIALAIAIVADLLFAFTEVIPVLPDLFVAVLLTIALGWRTELLPALILEAIPGVGIFPSWVVAVGVIAYRQRKAAQKSPLE